MDSRQTESVCATLPRSHYASLFNEVRKNGVEKAISNRMNGVSTENVERDVKAMREIADRNGF